MSTTLTNPIPVRLTDETLNDLKDIEEYTGTDKSKLLRLAVRFGLPEIRKRFGADALSKKPTPKKKGAKALATPTKGGRK